MNDYEKMIKQLKSMHITQLSNLMDDINDAETINLIAEVSCDWLSRYTDEIVLSTTESDEKQLDDAQRYRDHKVEMKCYE